MTNREAHAYMEDLQRIMTQYRQFFSEEFVYANGMAIEALEKQMPKDAHVLGKYWMCPVCWTGWSEKFEYCPDCGQKLRWE